ncbi:MAG: hypothetical protein HY823_00565 [Acidobacteria bacterium]|nr:hypothetical protein [Acidobacteriota bacterium]
MRCLKATLATCLAFEAMLPAWGQLASDPSLLTRGRWEATPCVERMQAVPGSPGEFFLRLKGVGPRSRNAYNINFGPHRTDPESWAATREGMVVFWAGVGPKQGNAAALELAARIGSKKMEGYNWALFSWKDGQLQRLATEDEPVDLPDMKKAFIRRSFARITPLGNRILFFFDNDGLFSFQHGLVAWDGKGFQTLLQGGKAAEIGGMPFQVRGLVDWGPSRDGGFWAQVSAKNESGGQFLWVLGREGKLEPLVSTVGKWPGTTIDASPLYTTLVRRAEPLVFKEGVVLQVDGGKFGRESVVVVGNSQTQVKAPREKLMELLETKYLVQVDLFCAGDPEDFLVKTVTRGSFAGNLQETLVHFRRGNLEKVFDREQAAAEKDKPYRIFQGVAVEGASPQYFFSAGSTWEEQDVAKSTLSTWAYEVLGRPRLYWFDGKEVRLAAREALVKHDSLRLTEGPTGRLLWGEFKTEFKLVITDTNSGRKVETTAPIQKKLITLSGGTVALVDPPRFALTNSQASLTLADVVAWVSDQEALALSESGLYRLKRVE